MERTRVILSGGWPRAGGAGGGDAGFCGGSSARQASPRPASTAGRAAAGPRRARNFRRSIERPSLPRSILEFPPGRYSICVHRRSGRSSMPQKARFLGELDEKKHAPLGVRDEIRKNLIRKMRDGEKLFPSIVGFKESVVPQIVN